jgi:RNA polymerase-binding protein DksA
VGKSLAKKHSAKKSVVKRPTREVGKKKKLTPARVVASHNGKVVKTVAPARPVSKAIAVKVNAVLIKPSKVQIAKPTKKAAKEPKEERRGIIIAAPVPTDTKPARNRAGIKSHELEHYRDLLLAKRRELVGDMTSMESEALQRGGNSNLSNLPMHMADMGTDNYEQEFTLGLMEKDRNLLREINTALAKIQDGSYGICEGTGNPINKPRLEAQPWAKYSIEYARKLEQRGVR